MSRLPLASELPEQGPHLGSLERLAPIARVVEEPASGLGSELVPRDLLLDQPRGPEAVLAESLRQELARAMQDVYPTPIDELEDADRRVPEAHAGFERPVHVLGAATPSSTRRTASFMSSACSLGPMNPGESAQRTGTLPSFSSMAMVRSTTPASVAWPGTTSTRGMMCAGLSQWTTRKRSPPRTKSTRCPGEMIELVEAMMTSGATRA